jgi:hypothetical protein
LEANIVFVKELPEWKVRGGQAEVVAVMAVVAAVVGAGAAAVEAAVAGMGAQLDWE